MYLVVFDLDREQYWLASSETFNPSNPLSSALTARNSTALAAIQNNMSRTNTTTGNSVQQNLASRTSGFLGVPHAMEQNVNLTLVVVNQNGRTSQIDSGATYIHFSPNATSQEALVYLRNSQNQIMSVTIEAASGRVRVRQLLPAEIEMLGFETGN